MILAFALAMGSKDSSERLSLLFEILIFNKLANLS